MKRITHDLYKVHTDAFSWYNMCIKKMENIILATVLKMVLSIRQQSHYPEAIYNTTFSAMCL